MLFIFRMFSVCLACMSLSLAAGGEGKPAPRTESKPAPTVRPAPAEVKDPKKAMQAALVGEDRGLDQKYIHEVYSDGDFDQVVSLIEAYTRTHSVYSKEDSIFIAKHLAVVYTANPATRERGKGYMFKLLDLIPSAKIVDMFVSDEIDHIFERVREEFVVRQEVMGRNKPSRYESNQYAADKMTLKDDKPGAPGDRPEKTAARRDGSKAWYWVLSGTAMVAAAGTTAYFMLQPDAEDKEFDIDPH